MLQLICGPSGSGKSAKITELIRQDIESKRICYLLVPEQQAYISERDLPKKLPKNAGLYFKIVNFTGLCRDVFQKFGGSVDLHADQTSRAVLMWEAIRSLDGVLQQYAKCAKSDAALTESMLGTVEDLQNCGVNSQTLEEIAEHLPKEAPLAAKLRDLSAIQATYALLLEERFGESAPDRLLHLAKTLQEHNFFAGANLYVDSFTSFTKPEYDVLTEVIRQCATVTVGLCMDQKPSIHFQNVNETAKRLKKCADLAGSATNRTFLTNETNCRPQALRVLERDLWRFDMQNAEKEELPNKGEDCVSLLACSNIYEEAEAVALNILDLVQNGMHYGDFAVFVRDPERYRGVLDAAMERHGIPCFFSDRTELAAKPLARLILSALRSVGGNYKTQDVITLVKTGLCGVSEREAALFEEYCETWKITGKRFLDNAWSMNPDGFETQMSARATEILETANRVRETVILPLQALDAGLRASRRLSDRLRAVYEYLGKINLQEVLSEQAEKELALGQVREAGESLRLYELVKNAFVLLCKLLPNATVSTAELLTLFEIVFSHSDLGSVPGVHDCVLIGSAATARAEGIRAAFLLGLTEGEFPKNVQSAGILTNAEKQTLREHGLDIEADPKLQSAEELFYVYRAVPKPLEKLYLSYPMLTSKGEENTQSIALRRISYLTGQEPKDFDLPHILPVLAESTAKIEPQDYRVAPWGTGASLRLSKTKINTFVKCPYSYYSQYVLKLRETKDAALANKDDGTFLHFVFEKFLKRMAEDDHYQFPEDEERLKKTVGGIVLEYLNQICPIPVAEMDTRVLHLFSRLQAIAVFLLEDIIVGIQNGSYQPKMFEATIGGEIPDLSLSLSEGRTVHLSGSIDRVDLYKEGDQTFVNIVDYKTGTAKFSLKEVESGRDMQLVFYLYAATKLDPAHSVPAGAYYLLIDKTGEHPTAKKSGFTLGDAESSKENGLEKMTRDEIEALIERVCANVIEISERIFSGCAEKTPSEIACQYCTVRENCNLAKPGKKFN